jgi:hypothetical protein
LTASDSEGYLTFKEAAPKLNIPIWKLRRAAKRGDFPTYRIFNKRALVRLSEVDAAIRAADGRR